MAQSQLAIETISLTKIFPDWWGRSRVVAVDELNLQVHHNEIYGFLGPNGSGKTTTIKLLLNLLHPTRGGAFLLGGQSSDPAVLMRIGYLPEESYLYKYLTAYETLDFYGRLFGLPSSVRKARVETLLDMVGLAGAGSRQIGTFSKGMARRIGLAQALINDPDLLILDEPTSGMDPMGTRQIKDLLVQLARRGKTIFLCSHLLADVEDVCDRISILYGGKMQVEGPVRQLLEQTGKTQIQAGRLSDLTIGRIREVLRQEQADCEVIHPLDKLESFFVRVVTKAQQQMQPTSGAAIGSAISGFLAEKEIVRQPDMLDNLVSTQVSQHPGQDKTDTTAVQAPSVLPHALPNQDLLKTLTTNQTKIPAQEPQTPAGTIQKPDDTVQKGVLEKLLGQEGKVDDTTTPVNRPVSGDKPQ